MAPTTRSRAQSADIGGFPVEPSTNNQETTPPPTAVRVRAGSTNNNDGSPTPMRGPAIMTAGGVESPNQNTTLNELQLKLQISRIECEKAEIEPKLVLKPINLNGSSNYLVWRESILSRVETAKCHLILNNEEEDSPFDEQQQDTTTTFWTEQNEWLYSYIWNSLSSQALAYIEKPIKRSAYLLWRHIEIKFRRPLKEERRDLFRQICTISHTNDRDFIKKLQDLRTKLFKINFPLSDWQILDILYNGLSGSGRLREFIQTKIEAKRTSKAVAVTLDIDTLLDEISTRLPAEINQSKSIDSSKPKSNDDTKPKSNKSPTRQQSRSRSQRRRRSQSNTTTTANTVTTPTTPTSERCSYCRRYGHGDSSCHYKNPHMRNEAWRHDNRHLIDHFKAQQEKYTKNSPVNPIDNQDMQYASVAIPIGLNSFEIAY
ncbi:hypothetical protein EMCG_01637 [[Emmonsia] crescens]|uniref:Retrotransposon Copia-like N-terminal domain-containing protein n=1 Tax=[Emmonsia] crescens TaxID=73230 RepID=A0A0G2I117_9EURO|nr:hypothetical protein EMCG_01637 [Emmonsia crescens UAMH 3008]